MNIGKSGSFQNNIQSEMVDACPKPFVDEGQINQNGSIRLKPNRIVFAVLFLSLFGFSIIISVVTDFKFRAAPLSLLVLPLFLYYRIKADKVTAAFGLLAILVVISGIQNQTLLMNVLLFMRVPVFSYLIYFLVAITLTPIFLEKVIKAFVFIAMIQLPIILLQWQLYNTLPSRLRGPAILVDFGTGTFSYDYPMVFLLIMMVIFLLFEENRNHFIRHRFFKAFWLSGTIIISNSQIMKIALLLIWSIYVIKGVNGKKLMIILFGVVLIGGAVLFMANKGLITENVTQFVTNLTNSGSLDTYLSGGYSRTAALKYLVTDGFSWLGAGPSAFIDPFTKTRFRGNTGHSFTFFSEIGFIGWLASMLIFFLISFPINNGKIKIGWSHALMFASICILSFTANVMNDVAVFLIFCIFSKTEILSTGHSTLARAVRTLTGDRYKNYNPIEQ